MAFLPISNKKTSIVYSSYDLNDLEEENIKYPYLNASDFMYCSFCHLKNASLSISNIAREYQLFFFLYHYNLLVELQLTELLNTTYLLLVKQTKIYL